MGPGPQASHQKGASHQTRRGLPREKTYFTFELCGGGKKSEEETREKIMERWRDGDRRMKKCEVNE
jgi:hypothetical protein